MSAFKFLFVIITLLTCTSSYADLSFFLSKKKTAHRWALFPYYFRSHILGHVASTRIFIFPTKKEGLYWSLSSKWKISQGHKLSLNTRLIYTFKNQSQFSIDGEMGSFYDSVYARDVPAPSLFEGLSHFQSIQVPSQKTQMRVQYIVPTSPSLFIGPFLEWKERKEGRKPCFIKRQGQRRKAQKCPLLSSYDKASALGVHWKYDTRDNIFNPKKGWLHQGDIRWAYDFVSSSIFSQIEMKLSSIFSLIQNETWWVHVAFGFTPYNNQKTLPHIYQFKLGGADRLRGHHLDRFRSDSYLLLQTEMRWPLLKWLEATLFTDMGLILEKWRRGAGVGIRLGIPPSYEQRLRLEWAYSKDQQNFVVSFAYPY